MEGEGEGDDQGSGWSEVKKKHRTSSKLSNQKISGDSFNKQKLYSPLFQASKVDEVGHLHSRGQVETTKEGVNITANSEASSDKYSSSLVVAHNGISCLEKIVSIVDNEPPQLKVAAPGGETRTIQELLIKQNVDVVPKIKWGDLEDVALCTSEGCETSTKTVKTDGIDCSDNIVQNTNIAESSEPVIDSSLSSPSSPLQLGKVNPQDSSVRDKTTDENCKVSQIPSEELVVVNGNLNDVDENFKNTDDSGSGRTNQTEPDGDFCPKDFTIKDCPSSPILLRKPHNESNGALVINESASMSDGLQDANMVPDTNVGVQISVDDSIKETTKSLKDVPDDLTEGVDTGQCEQGESKERFRERLWCFLFENLNRAVDELYLLCELECDMAQMDEAILVLEEAASDFKELKCRVEHFENTKRTAPQQSKEGVQVNMKIDHRRPHAISWEVRRMTTSPHRAEILSSSLEAFKKIQLDRGSMHVSRDAKDLSNLFSTADNNPRNSPSVTSKIREHKTNSGKQRGPINAGQGNTKTEKLNVDPSRQNRVGPVQPVQNQSTAVARFRREPLEPIKADKQTKSMDTGKKQNPLVDKEREKEKEKRNVAPWKPMDAWKEKRNWEDILKSPARTSTRVSYSPGLARRGVERSRGLHDKLMSPEKKKKTALDLKREAEEKHARATRIRSQLENERVQKLQRTSEKLNRVNEWQAVRSMKLREGMHARHQRSESRHEAYLAQVARRAGDESSKVNEVRFITSLNEGNKKLILRQKLHDSEMRRAEKLQVIRSKQKEDTAREEAVLERRKLLEAEKLNRLAETQRKKEEAQVRREEERKASSAAREAKALEQLRKKADRARAQQEEAELLAQKLAERLSESEQRRKSYLEQIREKASMDFRDQSSPLLRRSLIKDGPTRITCVEYFQSPCISGLGDSAVGLVNNATQQQSLKRRIKKIRQRLMALKYEFTDPLVSAESSGIGYRALVGTARAKIGRWLQDLQRLRQARKGAASIGLIIGEMVKFLEGKDPELHASRQAGLLDFISSALPASHTSKPEACQVTVYLLRLLRVVLSVHTNRSYFLVQNLLPPIIPMLSAALENYIKIAASSSTGGSGLLTNKASPENLEAIAEILDGFLWTVTMILGHACSDERQLQMQNGLLELIVSYQIVHRLRDLFALYDRPQVEGSPFPTSILLSLNLLAVLTSRSRIISSIDWEACVSKSESENKVEELKSLESQDIGDSSVISIPSEHITADLPDNIPLDCEFTKESSTKSDGQCDGETAKCSKTTADAKSVSPLKDGKSSVNGCTETKRSEQILQSNDESKKECRLKQPVVFLLSSITETGLVGLPSLLTAVLLQANNRLSSEQASYILPSNFEEVATGVLKVLNNLALLDIALLQRMLARPDLKMELFHLMSFLLSYCTSKWKAAGDQVGLLLLESLLLLGYFALFHQGNQAVLRWGKSPTILHKVCDLPFVFFSDPELTPILASTLVAACYGCDQNRGLLLQELSIDMLLSLLKSCRQGLLAAQSDAFEISLKPNHKVTKVTTGKGGNSVSNTKASKAKVLRDNKGTKTCDEWALKHSLPSSETSRTFMLHQRFPATFLDKAEEFFTSGSLDLQI